MKQRQYPIAILLVMGLTLVSGAVVGKMSNRWGPSQESLAAAKKLEEVPERFGNWELLSSGSMNESDVKMLECSGYISRSYVNQESGEVVKVFVILGSPGPISVHTPEVCYSSRANKSLETRKSVTVGASSDQFWAMTFERTDLNADLVRIYYAWTPGNHWVASENPRISLASCRHLYKIQVESYLPAGADLANSDPCKSFLEEFVPAMKNYLIDGSGDH